jgi:hypothetical protein
MKVGEEMKSIMNSGNLCNHSIGNLRGRVALNKTYEYNEEIQRKGGWIQID